MALRSGYVLGLFLSLAGFRGYRGHASKERNASRVSFLCEKIYILEILATHFLFFFFFLSLSHLAISDQV